MRAGRVLLLTLVLFLSLPSSETLARGRNRWILPEVGLGGGVYGGELGTFSMSRVDINWGVERMMDRTAPGLFLRIEHFITPQDVLRYHFGMLLTYSVQRPIRPGHFRFAAGPFISRVERHSIPTHHVGGQVELAAGVRNFVDLYAGAYLDPGGHRYNWGVSGGLRFSGALVRAIRYDKRLRWR